MATVIVDARRQIAKLEKVARAVSIGLRVPARENGVEECPPDQGRSQQPALYLGGIRQLGQQNVIAPVELARSVEDELLGERGLIEREQQFGGTRHVRVGLRFLTGTSPERIALGGGQDLSQLPIRVNPRRSPVDHRPDLTRLLNYVCAAARFRAEPVALEDMPFAGSSANLNELTIAVADLSRPVILAEIAPGQYNLIDGHHRAARARRESIESIPAYRVPCPEHVAFLTSTQAYLTYVEYWNSKVDDLVGARPRRVRRATTA